MIDQIAKLMGDYRNWLRESTALRSVGGAVEITTPFLDRHNDCIRIYVREVGDDRLLLTDEGETIDDLKMSGISLKTSMQKELMNVATAGFGIDFENAVMSVSASPKQFPLAMNNLVQAILSINDLYYTVKPSPKKKNVPIARMLNVVAEQNAMSGFFLNDVGDWLAAEKYKIRRNASFSGKLYEEYKFDYMIRKSRHSPDRFVQAIVDSDRVKAREFAFAWVDTEESRPPASKAFAVLDNRNKIIPPGLEDALYDYGIKPVLWTDRGRAAEILAA